MIDLKSEEQTIRQIVAMLQLAWNNGDAKTFVYDFAPDAEFITVTGEHFKGIEAILTYHTALLKTASKGVLIAIEGVRIRFIAPNAVWVYAEINVHTMQGNRFTPCITRPTQVILVLIKQHHRWEIIQAQHRFE
jgi:uncharacterized protein (TIGR02246 family)